MDDIQIIYEAYSKSFDNPLSFEEFSSNLQSAGGFANEVLSTVYNWNDNTRGAVDRVLQGTQPKAQQQNQAPLEAEVVTEVETDTPKKPLTQAEQMFQDKDPFAISDKEKLETEVAVSRLQEDELTDEISEIKSKIAKNTKLYPEYDELVNNAFVDESDEIDVNNPDQNVQAGPGGLTKDQANKINDKFDKETMFTPYQKEVYVSGIIDAYGTISGGRRITKTIQPYEEELKQAEKVIEKSLTGLNAVQKQERIQDYVFNSLIKDEKEKQRTANWENYIEKEDSWVDYLAYMSKFGGASRGGANTAHDKQVELIKKGIADKTNLENKQASLAQLRRNRNINIIEQKQEDAFELNKLLEVIDNPDLTYDLVAGEEYVTLEDGRNIPKYIYDKAQEQREELISLSNIVQKDEEQVKMAIEGSKDANTLLDITRRDYNDIKKFGVSLGLNSLDLVASTIYGAERLITSPAQIAASITGENLGVDPLSDTYTAFTNWKYEVMDDYQKDIAFDDIGFDNWNNIGKWLTQSASQQLPIIIGMVATGGISGAAAKAAGVTGRTLIGVQNVSSSAMIGLSSMGGKINDMNYDEFISGEEKYSEAEKLIKGTMYGVAEGTFAYFSTAPMLNRGVNKLSGLGANAAQQEVRTGAFDYLRGTLRKDILPETVGEMFFEGLTTGTQNLIDGRPFFENMNETLVSAGIWGFGMSGTPALYVAGTRNFANNKELKLIQDRQSKKNELLKANARLVDNKLKGNLIQATTDVDSEVKKNLEMIEVYDTEIVEAMNTVETNIKDKGMSDEAAKGYSEMQVEMANIRNKVLEVTNDPNKTESQKESEIEALGKQYNEVSYYQNLFTQTETFGSLYAALAGSSIFQSPFSEKRKKYRKVTQQAKDNITAKKGTDHKITRDEINTEAESILIDEKADVQLKKDEAQSKKLGHNFKVYGTKEEATTKINKLYDEAIESAGKETTRGKKLLDQKIEVLQKINKGTLNGLSIQVKDLINLDFVVRDNMRANRRFTTGLHEQTHRVSKELIAANPEAFKNLGRQIISYLSFTGQNAALLKMNVDNANIKADGDYDYDEVVSSFMELIADEKVNLELMDNFIAVTGKLFNEGLKNATDGKYNIEFTGEKDILAYFLSFGKKLASGEIDVAEIQELKSRINKEGKILSIVDAVESDAIAASETKATTNEALVDIINNPESTRRQRSSAIDTLVEENEGLILTALGFNKDIGDINAKELLDVVVKDQFLVKNMLGKFDKDRAKFSTYVFNLLKRRKKEIYEAAGLDANKFKTESLDKEEARQIAEAKRPDFDEDTDTESGRKITPVEDLKIVTPELVDEVKDIVTRTLKRTALTKGVSTDAVLEDINKAIEKEITKVIKDKMGPITRSVLGFAPKQYIDFIRDEMMNIVGAMPTNVIKQKAKSKAWAEIFKLTEIGREDIKKVNPDTGKVTNYRKQIFKLEKPDTTKFQRYFTRGGYTTLIERQKSLIKPMAQQLARSELARLRQDKPFIQDLAQRTGMTDLQVTELFVDTVIKDIESELDNTASEILQQDTVKFSETLASASNQSKQTFIDGLRSSTFRAMLADSFNDTNVKNPITNAITGYFRGKGLFKDLTDKQIGDIARQFNKPAVQRQVEAEAKKVDSNELAAIVSEAFERVVENQNDYKAIELALGINEVDFDKKSIASVNIGRQMALKVAIKIGREKFIKLFYLGLTGPDGLSGLEVPGTPQSLELTESDVTGFAKTARTGLFKNKADIFNNVINAKDANGNFLVGPSKGEIGNVTSLGYMNSKIYQKKWYTKNKEWDKLDGNRKAQLEYVNKIAEDGNVNKKIYRETILSLAGELTPTEARWLMSVDSGSMYGALKASASLIGFPDLNKKQLQESLNLAPNDPYILEHMTPAKYMALITYKYLLDPSSKNKNDFNTELDNFNTIILPEGIDDILRAEGKQAAMGLKHKIGDSPFDTRYDEVLKVMQLVKVDGDIIGESTSKFSETNNSRATQSFDANLINDSEVKFSESNQNTGISVIETEILDKALAIARDPNAPVKKIRVFDFDDTLAKSKSLVFYNRPNDSGRPVPKNKAIFMIGGPGSGKSNIGKGLQLGREGWKVVNQDIFIESEKAKQGLPEIEKDYTREQKSQRSKIGYAGRKAAEAKMDKYIKAGNGMVIDGTGASYNATMKKVNKLKEQGYEVFMVHAKTSNEVALERNRARKERSLPDFIVEKTQESVNKNISQYKSDLGDNFIEIDTETIEYGKPLPKEFVDNAKAKFYANERGRLNAEEFAQQGTGLIEQGFEMDFSDFNTVRDGEPGPLLSVAKKIQKARGTGDLFVLTARAPESEIAIKEFLSSVGLEVPLENITGLGNSSGLAKSSWIVDKAAQGYNDFYFADDAIQNVEAVKKALDVIDIKSQVQQAKVKFSETVDQAMNDIIYQKTGIESFKEYSDVRAQAEGRGKRSFDLIPASAEDFGGLLYRMLGKGTVGDAQWEWMQDNLIKPYNRGVNDLVVAQNTLAADFKELKQTLEGIPKDLKRKAFGGFTFEDVVRINTWTKQGINVEGISKKDLKEVNDFINENPELEVFSDQLIAITKGDGYYYPGKNWLAGTITTDFREGLRTTSRAKYLAQWQANVDEAFSSKNLNKIEAAFGSKFREALEDSLERMKTGTNRNQQMGRLESRFLDYINGSVGAVMFLNARSAVLQTISAINFINWGDNNVLAAGKAFANQPQYWKDFMTLMNSDYLVDRRNGLKINVSENEIAEAAKTSKNKAKAVISTLLSKGFVLTQIADSFAIASGGATFYRNRIKKLMKEGMSESEATKQAFQDFKEVSETSQQSADPSKISQQQASTIGKIILAWGNTPMQYNRIIKKASLDLVNRRGDWKDNMSKIIYYGALQNIIFTTLQTGLFAVAFGDDEEESDVLKEKGISTANSLIDNLLRGMGIGGAVVSTIKNLGIEIYDRSKRKKPDYADVALKLLDVAPPVDVKVSKFRQGLTTYEYSQKDPRREEFFNVDNPSYSAAAKVIAATTNVPVDRLLQKAQNLEDAMDDQNQWWKRAAMFLGWPEWQLRSTKEASEFKELMKERRKKYKEETTKRQAAFRVSNMSDEEKQSYEREQDSISYVKLNKPEQVQKLDSLGLTKKEIRALKYEKDRVNKLLELMEK